ncbi:lipase 1-like [Lucilia cuprina]|uniref:lipase 1-like n=1 Tax=Lucilia cuprina TaxID=7375 RepID=UPI001F064F39|nr:lipase 1-like [Lucilia cuprina]
MIFNKYQSYKKFVVCSVILKLWVLVDAGYMEDNYPKSIIEDADLDTAQLIHKYKYPVETHYVTTEDKYILRVHRIPKPKAPPVFLMHGLEDSSSTWILMGPQKAPGYFFSDNGYDVWLGNARGNRYSRNHTLFDPDTDRDFWKFTWNEIGYYDLAAMIDYVLTQTGYQKTGYFGHSQGTTSFWVLCSLRPEYNEKITMMHALAPVAYMKHVKSPLLGMAMNFVQASKEYLTDFIPRNEMLYKMCLISKISEDTCLDVFNKVVGKDMKQTNMTMLPAIFGHVPAGCNIKQVDHYLQLVKSNRFCKYDYGPQENMKHYGQTSPPEYPLKKITVPVGLYYTRNDYLSSVVDVKRLARMLPNVVVNSLYPYRKWNHMTMLWGIDARELAHKRMLEVMKNYPYE